MSQAMTPIAGLTPQAASSNSVADGEKCAVLSTTLERLAPWGATVLRLVIGAVFVMHGYQKFFVWGLDNVAGFMGKSGFPLPMLSAVLAASAEFGGGILLLLGLGARLAAIPMAFTMLMAFAMVHAHGGFFLPEGFEYVLTLFGALVAIILMGPGKLSADGLIRKKFKF